jgi:hypothetical protein
MRREGKGVTGCSSALMREDERGKKGGDGAPFIGNVVGVVDGPRAVPHGGEAWGGGASAWVGRCGVAGSGPAAALTSGTLVGATCLAL